jgi:hypothetical protein
VFIVPRSYGVISPNSSTLIHILLKEVLPPEYTKDSGEVFISCKIAVELCEYDDGHDSGDLHSFWSGRGKDAIRRTIACTVKSSSKLPEKTETESAIDESMQKSTFSKSPSMPVSTTSSADILSLVDISPSVLHFVEGTKRSEAYMEILNESEVCVAFRIRVSVRDMFHVPSSSGIVPPMQSRRLPVILTTVPKATEGDDSPSYIVQMQVELLLLDAAEEGFADADIKTLWISRKKEVSRRMVQVEVKRSRKASAPDIVVAPEEIELKGAHFVFMLIAWFMRHPYDLVLSHGSQAGKLHLRRTSRSQILANKRSCTASLHRRQRHFTSRDRAEFYLRVRLRSLVYR